jgi:hypothetical protein
MTAAYQQLRLSVAAFLQARGSVPPWLALAFLIGFVACSSKPVERNGQRHDRRCRRDRDGPDRHSPRSDSDLASIGTLSCVMSMMIVVRADREDLPAWRGLLRLPR